MKILIAGDWHSVLHEEALKDAFLKIGHEVIEFKWFSYFNDRKNTFIDVNLRIQRKFLFGPVVDKINSDLLQLVDETLPELVFIYRGTHIYQETIALIKKRHFKTKVFGYNNDDPFSEKYPFWVWRHFKSSMRFYDHLFVYRNENIIDARRYGIKNVSLLRSWYVPWKDYPQTLTNYEMKKFNNDVVFAGHFEADMRLRACENLLAAGVNFKLYGPFKGFGKSGWHGKYGKDSPLSSLEPFSWLPPDDYSKAISGAKIALCFLSKLNRDTYTRRVFEIPACETALFSEYSDDLADLYEEGREVEFFRSPEELREKVLYYLSQPEKLQSLTKSGSERVHRDGHDVISRAKYILSFI